MSAAQRADFFQQIGPGADAGDVIARSPAFDEETSYSRRQLICKAKRLLESEPATENMKHAFDHVPGHVRRRQAGVIAGGLDAVAAEYDRLNRDYTVLKDQYDRLVARRHGWHRTPLLQQRDDLQATRIELVVAKERGRRELGHQVGRQASV